AVRMAPVPEAYVEGGESPGAPRAPAGARKDGRPGTGSSPSPRAPEALQTTLVPCGNSAAQSAVQGTVPRVSGCLFRSIRTVATGGPVCRFSGVRVPAFPETARLTARRLRSGNVARPPSGARLFHEVSNTS